MLNTCVVDQNIHTAKLCGGVVDHGGDFGGLAHVCTAVTHFDAQRLDFGLGAGMVAKTIQNDICALLGELQGDAAMSEDMRHAALIDNKLRGEANVLICPNLDAANILFNVLKVTGGNGVTVGPILLGAAATAHVLTPSATVRRVVNMTALAVADSAHNSASN